MLKLALKLKIWSCAVRPTEKEVKELNLHYDEPYYEDRAIRIPATTAEEAIQKYREHHDLRNWLCPEEKPFVRAHEVKPYSYELRAHDIIQEDR